MTDETPLAGESTPDAPVAASENTQPETVETENTTDTADNAEASEEDKAEGEEQQKDKKQPLSEEEKIRRQMQKRIDRLTAKAKALEQLTANYEASRSQANPDDGKPNENDFESVEDYLKALGRWEAKKEIEADQAKKQQEQSEAEYQKKLAERQKDFEAKEAEFKKAHVDYDEVVENVNDFIAELTPQQKDSVEFKVFRDFMMESENLPALSYHLGQNPDLMEELTEMHPLKMVKELTKIELSLEAAPNKQADVKPLASPPNPVQGKSKSSKDFIDLSGAEMMKKMNIKY